MPRTLLFCCLSAVVAASAPSAPPPSWSEGGAPAVTWRPERPLQGRLFTVRVAAAAGDDPVDPVAVQGRAAGEALHFQRSPDGAFESLAAVPVDASGSVTVTLSLRYADGHEEPARFEVPVDASHYEHEHLTVAPELGAPLTGANAARFARDQAKAAEVSREAHATPRLWTDQVVMPRNDRVTSGFGNGREFNGQVSSRHLGLDLHGEIGDTVVAVARGVVALVDDFLLAGNIVYVNHGGGLLSGYFHLSEQLVEAGDTVEAGTPIGRVGDTGRVTGPHLHWVVRYGSTSVDPRSLMEVLRPH